MPVGKAKHSEAEQPSGKLAHEVPSPVTEGPPVCVHVPGSSLRNGATWLTLGPAWLSNAVRAMIPDDFIPSPVAPVQQEDAQAPGGPRRSLAHMGALRRVSLAVDCAEVTADLESSVPLSAPANAPEATCPDPAACVSD